jgi:hypothetical protein
MNKKKTVDYLPSVNLDIRQFVRKYINDISHNDFNALINQIAYLDQFKSIQLQKGSRHYLNDVLSKAIRYLLPDVLYHNVFEFGQKDFQIELVDFGTQLIYRAQLIYPDDELRVTVRFFSDREEAENYLVDKLSNPLLLEKVNVAA